MEPTIILTTDPKCLTMSEEIFGPVLTVYVYDDDKMKETIQTMKETSSNLFVLFFASKKMSQIANVPFEVF